MPHLTNVKEVQRLVGRIIALSRFISRSTDRCVAVFKILKNHKSFYWTPECATTFEDLKSYLISLSILSKPEGREELYLYLAVSTCAVSSILVRVVVRAQKLVYYVSKALESAETRYSDIEKLVLTMFVSSKKLHPYFQSHTIVVVTSYLLRIVLYSPDIAGRLMKW